MPVHDWTGMPDFLFHAFHHEWVSALAFGINRWFGAEHAYYALPEQFAGGFGPEVLTRSRGPASGDANGHHGIDFAPPRASGGGGTAMATRQPRLRRVAEREAGWYAAKKKSVAEVWRRELADGTAA